MKILYAIQGTGNGHLCRAMDIIPVLKNIGEVDILVSGTQAEIALPYHIKYKMKGLGFIFGKKGGVDIWNTLLRNDLRRFVKEIGMVPVKNYDLVINDFEPVSAWACFFKRKFCLGLSHQAAVIAPNAPLPDHRDYMGRFILKYYAPATESHGFHFMRFNNRIYTPVIRKQVRELVLSNKGHYTVYLPAYSDKKILKVLSRFKQVKWDVFSKHNKEPFSDEHISIKPIDNETFLQSMASSAGVLCGAGFETPSEALFLRKKLLVIPMANQYEQQCNAAALQYMGVTVLKNLKKKQEPLISDWLYNDRRIKVDFPDMTADLIHDLLNKHLVSSLSAINGSFFNRVGPSIS